MDVIIYFLQLIDMKTDSNQFLTHGTGINLQQ